MPNHEKGRLKPTTGFRRPLFDVADEIALPSIGATPISSCRKRRKPFESNPYGDK
ncbi:hypothetical protein NEISICOT_00470 [Neisseria sicca ATCC 29256]|uniref:Uncharacterized protein n=1 Tax=Neisseria sicca ATCC 29256 TaxID=547045 RepID=C6M1T3_NEISI|nr:hypothetical protein NEISICOT_00470 [Neisseria sicca ATCC 29256]